MLSLLRDLWRALCRRFFPRPVVLPPGTRDPKRQRDWAPPPPREPE